MKAITDPTIPTNGGCFRPIQLKLPRGSIVNPIQPAPVNGRTATIRRVTDCLLGAFEDVLPKQIPGHAAGTCL